VKSAVAAAVITACCLWNPTHMPAQEPHRRLEILQQWQGVSHNSELLQQGPEQPFILTSDEWQRVWKLWRPDEDVPKVDFDSDLVLVATIRGPNRLRGGAFLDQQGNVGLILSSTRVAGPGFGYLLLQVAREGIRSVNGKSLDPDAPTPQYIDVEIKGLLRGGAIAIGGETTGTVILASNLSFELDFGDQAELREAARKLNGQTVLVTGRLEGRRGVEIPLRSVVNVKTLAAAPADETKDE
jgi:hypothetical protein